jgi:hypothetical protein
VGVLVPVIVISIEIRRTDFMSENILEQTSAGVNSGVSYCWTPHLNRGMFSFGKCFGFSRLGETQLVQNGWDKDFIERHACPG